MADTTIDPSVIEAMAGSVGQGGQEPQLTPEQMAALQQGQGAQPPAANGPTPEQVAMIQAQQAQMKQAAQATQPGQELDEIEQAKQLLGLDQTQAALQSMEQKLQQLELEKAEAQMRAKYPDVPPEAVEKEIERMKNADPNFAESLKNNPAGLEMVYRAARAELNPKEKPDQLTDDGGSGGAGGEEGLEEIVKSGKADDFSLGSYILGMQ